MLRPSIFSNNFVDNMFDNFFDDSFMPNQFLRTTGAMSTDVRETEDSYQIDMELPGFAKEDVKAELKDGYLTISAAHDENKDEKDHDGKYIRRERYSGSYQRSFYVGDAVTETDIKAKYKDGVLTLMIPKKEKTPEVDHKKFIAIEGE